jgi:hypothetical protein
VLLRNPTQVVAGRFGPTPPPSAGRFWPLGNIYLIAIKTDLLSYFQETISKACAFDRTRLYQLGTFPVNSQKTPPEGSPEYYRMRAAEMLKRAEAAATEDARLSFIQLASNWQMLAQTLEHPNW